MQVAAGGASYEVEAMEVVAISRDVRVVAFTLAAGQSIPWHRHSTADETIFCLEGEVEMEVREPQRSFRVRLGERGAIPADQVHRVLNAAPGRTRFLLVQSGGAFDFLPASA